MTTRNVYHLQLPLSSTITLVLCLSLFINTCSFSSITVKSLYTKLNQREDDIDDWDADLFAQIKSVADIDISEKEPTTKDISSTAWDMRRSSGAEIKSMRDQIKDLWKAGDIKGKPTADWMPGYGEGPNEDEPWFTG